MLTARAVPPPGTSCAAARTRRPRARRGGRAGAAATRRSARAAGGHAAKLSDATHFVLCTPGSAGTMMRAGIAVVERQVGAVDPQRQQRVGGSCTWSRAQRRLAQHAARLQRSHEHARRRPARPAARGESASRTPVQCCVVDQPSTQAIGSRAVRCAQRQQLVAGERDSRRRRRSSQPPARAGHRRRDAAPWRAVLLTGKPSGPSRSPPRGARNGDARAAARRSTARRWRRAAPPRPRRRSRAARGARSSARAGLRAQPPRLRRPACGRSSRSGSRRARAR